MVTPDLMTFAQWSSVVGDMLERRFRGIIRPVPTGGEDWKNWASVIVSNSAIATLAAPSPHQHASWQGWARAFNNTVRYQ